ncbi:MAG: hypothetical protein JW727_05850 [Candidatus Aenigmarchaeota archaeon]|nr:hypothetical protein [Candidatus Aenigmarchaeota archaeon]
MSERDIGIASALQALGEAAGYGWLDYSNRRNIRSILGPSDVERALVKCTPDIGKRCKRMLEDAPTNSTGVTIKNLYALSNGLSAEFLYPALQEFLSTKIYGRSLLEEENPTTRKSHTNRINLILSDLGQMGVFETRNIALSSEDYGWLLKGSEPTPEELIFLKKNLDQLPAYRQGIVYGDRIGGCWDISLLPDQPYRLTRRSRRQI